MLKNRRIGITLGDPGGIGTEIVAKALNRPQLKKLACYTLIGDTVLFKKFALKESPSLRLFGVDHFSSLSNIKKGVSADNGRAALSYLQKAAALLRSKEIDALVTAPVCKESIAMTQKDFLGHTEFLAKYFAAKHVEMMFVHKDLRLVIATRHLPLKEVAGAITTERLIDTITTTHKALKELLHIQKPKLAVCGLNPHAGESELLGKEEVETIIPAIKKMRERGLDIHGPFAADTLFIPQNLKRFDCFIAMYHDQGLIPAKTLYFDKLVNLTIGLPCIRTSPDHGTAFDIAGKNIADCSSMAEAIALAARLGK